MEQVKKLRWNWPSLVHVENGSQTEEIGGYIYLCSDKIEDVRLLAKLCLIDGLMINVVFNTDRLYCSC